MKLIVGLGNPGTIYSGSRHNIGFSVIKALSRIYKIPLKRDALVLALAGKGKIDGESLVLAVPLTYMNLSGRAVSALIKKYKLSLNDILIVCDDLDLEFGKLRIRSRGSSGGHRGLRSIIDSVGSPEFARLRLGIGRPSRGNADAADYVLSSFTKKEKTEIKAIIENACECCRVWAAQGITQSMNLFNRRRFSEDE
ncbi:MAG: aminoacyl-tRNA hydrolase [Candidatus Omnitrophica bacterium]|nr:aminoacyl-tRNA hydrolase [Candidatus Omnitrophota bacterium]MDD5552611.1 aminoacyl-tRNA hydrolase [Candidatus Omnitrophota bacterium]